MNYIVIGVTNTASYGIYATEEMASKRLSWLKKTGIQATIKRIV